MSITDEMVECAAEAIWEHSLTGFTGGRAAFLMLARAALEAAERAREAAGYVIVPAEPTRAMLDVAVAVVSRNEADQVYCAMIEAAPK